MSLIPIEDPDIKKIRKMLFQLTITPAYKGFDYATYAIWLCVQKPEYLKQATTRLYPLVAEHFGTTPMCVDRNIRTIARVAWDYNPELLSKLAGVKLRAKPRNVRFLSIIYWRLFGAKYIN